MNDTLPRLLAVAREPWAHDFAGTFDPPTVLAMLRVCEAACVVDDINYEGSGGRPSLHELHLALTALSRHVEGTSEEKR